MNKELLNKEYYNFIEEISIDFIERYNCRIIEDYNSISITVVLENEDSLSDVKIKILHQNELLDILTQMEYLIEKSKEKREIEYRFGKGYKYIELHFHW